MDVIVTGSSRGIGRGIATYLAEQDHTVVVHGPEENDELRESFEAVKAISPSSICVTADLGDVDAIAAMFDRIGDALGGIDGLVNNAALLPDGSSLHDMPVELWDRTLAVNLRGPFLCGRHAAQLMRKRGGGRIVNIASIHATVPRREFASYSVAKAGLTMLTMCMATEWADDRIQVNWVSPGAVATEMTTAERQALINPLIPAHRAAQPVEIAGIVAYLLSDSADYITGSGITVDGGLTLGFSANGVD